MSKASDDFPDPLTPVMIDQLARGQRDVDVLEVVRPRPAHDRAGFGSSASESGLGVATVTNSLGIRKPASYYRAWICAKPPAPVRPAIPSPRLQSRQRNRVLRRRNQECDTQTRDGDEPPKVEERHSTEGSQADVRIVAQGDGSDRQQDSQLRGPDPAERHPEHTSHGCRQEHFARHQQIRHEQRERDDRRHERRGRQPPEKHRGPDDVEDVIEVEAVSRPLDFADAGKRAVETVAEPIDGERHDDHPERARVPARQDVAGTRDDHRRHRQPGQMV